MLNLYNTHLGQYPKRNRQPIKTSWKGYAVKEALSQLRDTQTRSTALSLSQNQTDRFDFGQIQRTLMQALKGTSALRRRLMMLVPNSMAQNTSRQSISSQDTDYSVMTTFNTLWGKYKWLRLARVWSKSQCRCVPRETECSS